MIDNKLLSSLYTDKCVVSYEKIEGPNKGDVRDMLCTLNPELIPTHNKIHQNPASDHLLVWCLDRDGWRSVRADTITGWKVAEDES